MPLHQLASVLRQLDPQSTERPIPERTVEASDYDTGKAQIDADVPEGWVLLWVRVEG